MLWIFISIIVPKFCRSVKLHHLSHPWTIGKIYRKIIKRILWPTQKSLHEIRKWTCTVYIDEGQSILVHRTRKSDRKTCSARFLSGRCGAHSIHTALQFLFRPGLMMHAGIYPLLPRYFPRFVEARFDGTNRCASAHAHVSYTSVCLLYIELSINRHLCYRPITWDVQQFNWDFQNCALLFLVSLDAFNVQKKGDLLNWMF